MIDNLYKNNDIIMQTDIVRHRDGTPRTLLNYEERTSFRLFVKMKNISSHSVVKMGGEQVENLIYIWRDYRTFRKKWNC